MGWAMKLTLLRIACIPLFIIFYHFHPESCGQWIALIIYTIACISDYFDGYLARKLNEVSPFGAFLDPVADKLMVCTVLVCVLKENPQAWLLICSLIIICREIFISALREWLAILNKKDAVAVNKLGKWKTTAQMFSLGFLIYREDFLGLPIWYIGEVLLFIASALTIISLFEYTKNAYLVMYDQNK